MKWVGRYAVKAHKWSHPARGAWVEMGEVSGHHGVRRGRTPQGVRGLKYMGNRAEIEYLHVAPRKGCVG